jgi:prepilin peptidase CpaA
MMLEAIILVVFPFAMAFAALSDLLTMTIANRVSLLLVGTFALVAPMIGMDLATYGMHFAAGGMMLAITFTLFAMGGLGGGDAKLLTAIAVWCGLSDVLVEYMLYATLLGGLLTVVLVMWRGSFTAQLAGMHFSFLERLGRHDVGIPYGIALGAAGLITAPSMPLVKWAVSSIAL